jgi:hypothetical protein
MQKPFGTDLSSAAGAARSHRPPQLIEYRTVHGPVRNHLGRIELTRRPDGGTRLDYRISFDAPPWMPGSALAATINTTWRFWSLPRLRAKIGSP